jgi:Fic family protein
VVDQASTISRLSSLRSAGHRKAAALAQSLAQNHGFVDGNKRTAFYMVDLLLANSG